MNAIVSIWAIHYNTSPIHEFIGGFLASNALYFPNDSQILQVGFHTKIIEKFQLVHQIIWNYLRIPQEFRCTLFLLQNSNHIS